jgi:hypothetical protein
MVALLFVLALVAGAGRVAAQATSSVAAGVEFERYSFEKPEVLDIESLTLLTMPFGARVDLTRRITFSVTGAWARATLVNSDGGSTDLSELTDTEARLEFALVPGSVVLSAVGLLPTGSSALTFEEMIVAGAIAADQLPFRVTHWGTGGGAGASLALSRGFGDWSAGASVGYVVGRTFEPLEGDAFEYRPGNQLQAIAAIDRLLGSRTKAALQVKYQNFGADQGDGSNLFQTGDRLTAVGSLDFPIGQSSAIVYAGWYERDTAELFDPEPEVFPSQTMIYAGAGLRTALGSAVLQPSIDVRSVDTDAGPGWTMGVGAQLEAPAGTAMLIPTARFRLGSAESVDGVKTGLTGVDVGFSVRFGAGQR